MKIFTAAQMRELDRLTVERCGIPYATLMETAGSRVVEAILDQYGSIAGKEVAIFCGKGNNGGDGAVVARLLWLKGAARVGIYLLGRIDETKGEAFANFKAVARLAEENTSHESGRWIWILETPGEADLEVSISADLVIDALLGTGLARPAEGVYQKAINHINERNKFGGNAPVVSIDIPSGLSSDDEHSFGPHVVADLTVSFTGPKIGNVLAPACEANGKLVIASIGTPAWLLNEVGSQLNLVEEAQIRAFLDTSRRPANAHKGTAGDVLLIAGSLGKTGAAALASEAVLRAGAGLVTVATSRSAQTLLVTQCKNEVMTEGLDENKAGAIKHEALELALELTANRTVLALGPGLSANDESTRRFVREVVERRSMPMIIDADGLNALAPWPDKLKGSDDLPLIITPHPGEMARLTGQTNADILADRLNIAREFATQHHVITVLKGSRSLIAAPDGQVYVNPTGNAGMATAGSGDVLTGLLTGLLAQCPQAPLEATIAAVYLHGLAGDLAAAQLGQRSLIASDLITHLSAAILQIGGAAEGGQSNPITTI
jgi:ADP-dependent NAD(P)H-hydrate dehydratase / NAD(P)H-hydrate epimerase